GVGFGGELGLELLETFAVAPGNLLHDPVARRLTGLRVVEHAERHPGEQEDAVTGPVALLLGLALELVGRLGEVGDENLELLLEVLLGDLLRLALEPSALRHLAVDAAGGDQ